METFHTSTKIESKYTSQEDMLKEFHDNPRDLEWKRRKLKNDFFKITGNEILIIFGHSMKPLCNRCNS